MKRTAPEKILSKYFFHKRFARNLAAAALILSLVAGSAGEPAMAASQNAGAEQVSASSGSAVKNETEKASVQGDVLDDVFGEVVMYRWKRVKAGTHPQDGKWHPTLLTYEDWGCVSVKAPSSIWGTPEAPAFEGVTHFFKKSDQVYSDLYMEGGGFSGKSNAYSSYMLRIDDSSVNVSKMDRQICPWNDEFYTDSDRNCLYVKYVKNDNKNGDSPKCFIKLSKDDENAADYYIRGETYDGGGIYLSNSLPSLNDKDGVDTFGWTFEPSGDNLYGIFHEQFIVKDTYLETQSEVGTGKVRNYVYGYMGERTRYKWFTGEKVRYSCIKDDMAIRKGQILSIGKANYISTEDGGTGSGAAEAANGVILQGGQTITIEKGGILSIDGEFINNGTIINNGGTILIKEGGSISPFLQGDDTAKLGCGSIKCNGGDIIIEKGGALYAGLFDGRLQDVPFYLDNSSTLINYGLLVYGTMRLGDAARVELRGDGRIYGSMVTYGTRLFSINGSDYPSVEAADKAYREKGEAVEVYGKSGNDYLAVQRISLDRQMMLTYYTDELMKGNDSNLDALKLTVTGARSVYISDSASRKPHILVEKGKEDNYRDMNLEKMITVEYVDL